MRSTKFRFDKRIRYCGLIDEKGTLISGSLRKGITSLEPESEAPRLLSQIAIAVAMDRNWNKFFGRTKALVIFKEKVSIFIYSLSNFKAIILAVEPDFPMRKMKKLGEVIGTSDLGV